VPTPVNINLERAMTKITLIQRCQAGGTAIEYALVASLIAVAAITGMRSIGTKMDVMFNNVSNHL
jgi:pilus assembly protein Flp/PilA